MCEQEAATGRVQKDRPWRGVHLDLTNEGIHFLIHGRSVFTLHQKELAVTLVQ
jgi:hypothetical protein